MNLESLVSPNNAVARTMGDFLAELGDIPADRVLLEPVPGKATLDDLMAINESKENRLHELVGGTLVEKAMGFEASVVATTILTIFHQFVANHKLGLVSGSDGFFQLDSSTRGPDVAFLSIDRLPSGVFPKDAYPRLVPNLVVEVLSPGNTKGEMTRKRLEYFHSGTQVVWIVDCTHRTVAVYSSVEDVVVVSDKEAIDGGIALPEFRTHVKDFFADLDIGLNAE